MPHFVIEQGNALTTDDDRAEAMRIAGEVGAACGFIDGSDIKLRIVDFADFSLRDGRRSFVHLTVHLLAGRTAQQKESLTVALREAFVERFPDVDSLSFTCVDMEPVSYKKHLRP